LVSALVDKFFPQSFMTSALVDKFFPQSSMMSALVDKFFPQSSMTNALVYKLFPQSSITHQRKRSLCDITKLVMISKSALGSMLSTIFFRKFFIGVKKLGRFKNFKKYFSLVKRPNFFTFSLRRKIF